MNYAVGGEKSTLFPISLNLFKSTVSAFDNKEIQSFLCILDTLI